MKYYFFRELHNNPWLGEHGSFHPAGVVLEIDPSNECCGKDLLIRYIDPFEQQVTATWSTASEVELFETDEYTWRAQNEFMDRIESHFC